MLLLYILLFLPVLAVTDAAESTLMQEDAGMQVEDPRYKFDHMAQGITGLVDLLLPSPSTDEARKKKKFKLNKYILPLIVGFILIKSILLPIALKALAVLSGKAVVLSLMSLILAAIVGLKKVAQTSSGGNYDVVNVTPTKYRRQDVYDVAEDMPENEPYKYYKERRRKK